MAWNSRTIGVVLVLAACRGEDAVEGATYGPGDSAAGTGSVGAGDDLSQMEDSFPEGPCGDSETGACPATTDTDPLVGGDQCQSSEDCGVGVCVAEFGGTERAAYACVVTCVPTLDEDWWCSDDASCCDPEDRCNARGYCRGPDDEPSPESTSSDSGTGESSESGSSETAESTG